MEQTVISIIHNPVEDYYGYDCNIEKLNSMPVDELYRLLGEVLGVLDEVYTEIGKRNVKK